MKYLAVYPIWAILELGGVRPPDRAAWLARLNGWGVLAGVALWLSLADAVLGLIGRLL